MHRLLAGAVALSIVSSTGLAQPCAAPRRTQWSQNILQLAAPTPEGLGSLLATSNAWVAAGDVDADGHDDIIIAAPECQLSDCVDSVGAGAPGMRRPVVRVVSGRTGQSIGEFVWPSEPTVNGQANYSAFGWTLAAADFNGDGHADVAVAASFEKVDVTGDEALEPQVGAVFVFSGATMELLYRLQGDLPNSRFGFAMASVGDWNQDGAPDLMVAESPNAANGGELFVFSGRDGAPLGRVLGSAAGLSDVVEIVNIGDASGDGEDDAAVSVVGDPGQFGGFKIVSSSAFDIVSAAPTHAALYTRPARVGDATGDGLADLVVNGYTGLSETVCVYSGDTGALVLEFDAGAFGSDGYRVFSPVGDVNGDGVPDIAVGPSVIMGETPTWERLRVYSLMDGACLGYWETALRAAPTEKGGPETTLADAYSALVSGDFDGDGLLDVASVGVVENQYSPPYFLYQINIFRRPGCPEDMTGDGVIDFADLSTLLDTFNDIASPGMIPADIDGNGQVDFGDLNLILALFNSAC